MTNRTLYVPGTEETDLKKIIMSLQQIAGVVAEGIGGRETLAANRTYYVRTDGSDSNDGLTNIAAGAFLTIGAAVQAAYEIDLAGFDVTIQCANGTYNENVLVDSPFIGGDVTISGDTTTPSNVVLNAASGSALVCSGLGNRIFVQGIKFTAAAGAALSAATGGFLRVTGKIEFGACNYHFATQLGGNLLCFTQSYIISGGAINHMISTGLSIMTVVGNSVTLTGTPAFSGAFATADTGAALFGYSNTYTGAATGTRYTVTNNAFILVLGAGATYFPGNAGGSPAAGAGAAQWYN